MALTTCLPQHMSHKTQRAVLSICTDINTDTSVFAELMSQHNLLHNAFQNNIAV